MIPLSRDRSPVGLGPHSETIAVSKYRLDGTAVWRTNAIEQTLFDISHGKCAYCEVPLGEGTAYMEVDHFVAKDLDDSLVANWDNLLPSCKRCNVHKGTHDVRSDPLVNPFVDEPADHLCFSEYLIQHRDTKGKRTVTELDLNSWERLVEPRFNVGKAVHLALQASIALADLYDHSHAPQTRTRLVERVELLLRDCAPPADFAATASTVLHSRPDYGDLVVRLQGYGLWSVQLERRAQDARRIVLPRC